MGQLSNTTGLLLNTNKDWLSKWYTDYNYSSIIHQDRNIKDYIHTVLSKKNVYYSKCIIDRSREYISISINLNINENNKINKEPLMKTMQESISKYTESNVIIHCNTTSKVDASIIGHMIKEKLIGRAPFQLIYTRILNLVKKDNRIKGIKIQCSGRPNGNDMSSVQWHKHGSIPLHSYNKKIDYCFTEVNTKFGICGVKVWIYYN